MSEFRSLFQAPEDKARKALPLRHWGAGSMVEAAPVGLVCLILK